MNEKIYSRIASCIQLVAKKCRKKESPKALQKRLQELVKQAIQSGEEARADILSPRLASV